MITQAEVKQEQLQHYLAVAQSAQSDIRLMLGKIELAHAAVPLSYRAALKNPSDLLRAAVDEAVSNPKA